MNPNSPEYEMYFKDQIIFNVLHSESLDIKQLLDEYNELQISQRLLKLAETLWQERKYFKPARLTNT